MNIRNDLNRIRIQPSKIILMAYSNLLTLTFMGHLKGVNTHARLGRRNDLTVEMEAELVHHVLILESHFFGLTIRTLRQFI